MAAKTAYIMLGHGNEIVNKKSTKNIVPPGCTLVVEVHSGELNYFVDFNKIIEYDNKKIFLDPINNYKELVTNFSNTKKSFAIYKEGSEYPDFSYLLLSEWDRPNNMTKLQDSGIIKYPFNPIKPNHVLPKYEHYSSYEPIDILIDKFRMSIYPSKQQVTNYLQNKNMNTLNDVFNDNFKFLEFKKMLRVTQSKLFKILPPGVFYNFVCRATNASILEKADIVISHKGIENIYSIETLRDNIRIPIKDKKYTDNYFVPEIINQISEAEIHRKPYINKLKLNKVDKNVESKILSLQKKINLIESDIKNIEHVINQDQKYINNLEISINESINTINRNKKLYAESKNRGTSSKILEHINKNEKEIKNNKKIINTYKQLIANNNIILFKYKKDISLINNEINKHRIFLSNPIINKSTNNYIWEKQDKKWGKVTIKNRNNKGELPEGWKLYSTNTEKWYESPSGTLQWTRPEITTKNYDKKGSLPEGWVVESNGDAQWYKAPSGTLQWTRPQITVKNRNNKGKLPEGWVVKSNGDAKWYKAPSGTLQWTRPEITVKTSDKKGPLPEGWVVESNGNAQWYTGPSGNPQWTRPILTPIPISKSVPVPVPEIEDPIIPNKNNISDEENNPNPINTHNNNSIQYSSLLQKRQNNSLLKTRKKKTFTQMIKGLFGF
jgi:hypothetical protein